MSTARLTCLLAAAAVGAAVVPAAAAPTPPPVPAPAVAGEAPALVELDPARALRSATRDLLAAPSTQTAAAWRAATLARVAQDPEEAASSASSSSAPREHVATYSAGDVDGDRRQDVVVLRGAGAVVRSGRDGAVLLRRDAGFLFPVDGSGRVRLVALDAAFEETPQGFTITLRYTGLDSRGRDVWTHESTGAVRAEGAGPAYVVTYERLPLLLGAHRDGAGGAALLLGSGTGMGSEQTGAAELALDVLSLQDGSRTALPPLHGAGGLPYASPMDPELEPGCYTATEPAGPTTLVSLRCAAGGPSWVRPVSLEQAYAGDAGRFDGDRRGDVLVSTSGFEPTAGQDLLRGTRVLSGADGSQLGTSAREGLVPMRGDADGDGQPDFLELVFSPEGITVQGVTLAGKVLYRRSIEFRGAGFLEVLLGLDVTGDGIGDGFLRAEPERGTPVAVVLEGRTGLARRVPGVDALVTPGLRSRGADLLVLDTVRRRPVATVLSGDRGRPLLSAPLPGRGGAVAAGGAATAIHLDRDRRRDLVVASRVGEARLTTAYSAGGRVLWQVREKAPRGGDDVLVLVGGS